jgi:hypothetical protein
MTDEMLTATQTFSHAGCQFVAGVSRIAPNHPFLRDPTVRARFAYEDADLGEDVDEAEPRSLAAAARLLDVTIELVGLGVIESDGLLAFEVRHLLERLNEED